MVGQKPDQRAGGIELVPAHFPGRAPIDTYGNGGFRFADMSHRGSILCLPSGIYGWDVEQPDNFTSTTFKRLLNEEGFDVLLVGTGHDLTPLPAVLKEKLQARGIRADVMSTGAAARTYNVLLAEGRAVAAALLAVE